MDEKLIALCEDVSALKTGLQSMDEKLDRLTYYLQGNGRPGVITELRDADTKLNDRMDASDVRFSRWTGIGIGVWGVMSLLWIAVQAIHLWKR